MKLEFLATARITGILLLLSLLMKNHSNADFRLYLFIVNDG